MTTTTRDDPPSSDRPAGCGSRVPVGQGAWAGGLREVALLAGLYVVYTLTRVLAANDLDAARDRASGIRHLEGVLHIDAESWLNRSTSSLVWLAVPLDYWYCALHYLVTPAVLVWLFVRRRGDYGRARNALVVASALGLVCYLLFPTAPPRLMGTAYVDTLARYADFGWWTEHASAPAGLGGLTNELAAMPSLHVGWACWVAWALHTHLRGRWAPLVYVYPLATALVTVCTGNHWVLDAVMGAAVTLVGILTSRLLPGRGGRPRPRRLPSRPD